MSDKKRLKHQKHDEEKPTKDEYAVAKFLRFGLPVKEGKLHGMEVNCFIASAAVDKLLDSKWSAVRNKKDALFTNRGSCINYLNILLQKGLFHRADRDRRKKDKEKDASKKKKKEKEKDESAVDDSVKQRKSKKEKKSKKEEEGNDDTEGKDETEKKTEKKEEKKKKEKRFKLLMSEEQWFEDGDGVYVWIYDPVNAKTFIIGLLMVLGAIGLCMFPLWPEAVRIGVYYLSLAGAGFIGFILFLIVLRLILFCLVWALTLGRHHFWFLPNLTEDVGFFESFRPAYKHDYMPGCKEEADSGKKKKKSKKTEDSGASEKKEKSSDKDDTDEFEVIKKEELDESKAEEEDEDDETVEDNNDDADEDDADLNSNDNDSDDKENNETKKSK